ncbi:MAG: tRNA pseudouridine(55) synthase TruB [bacterium]
MLLIDKPKGITSFDVIRILRKKLGVKKIGHTGTLDPLASGLLLVAVGEETKEISKYVGLPKEYEVEALIGERRETGDMEGEVVEEKAAPKFSMEVIGKVARDMVGEHMLPVPKYSAIKRGGEPLYKKARRGEEVEVPIKKMEVRSFKVEHTIWRNDKNFIKIVMEVSSGSYVRSIVEEFGKRLGYPATTKELRRTRVGILDVKDARVIL